jgi:hypothetical protein
MNLRRIYVAFSSKEAAANFLQENNILPKERQCTNGHIEASLIHIYVNLCTKTETKLKDISRLVRTHLNCIGFVYSFVTFLLWGKLLKSPFTRPYPLSVHSERKNAPFFISKAVWIADGKFHTSIHKDEKDQKQELYLFISLDMKIFI